MANNNTQDIQINQQQGQQSIVDSPQNQNEVEEIFNSVKQSIIDGDNSMGGHNHPNAELPGIVGNQLVNISIREIDKNIDEHIKSDSFDEFKKQKQNQQYSDETTLKYLYFNEVLSKVVGSIDNNSQVYCQTKSDYDTLAKYLQEKTIKLIKDSNKGSDLGNDRETTSNKYINLYVDDITEGTKDNSYCSSARIINNANLPLEYGDHSTVIEKPFISSVDCTFNASRGFNCNTVINNKTKPIQEINKIGTKYEEQNDRKKWFIAFLIILAILCAALAIAAGILGYLYTKKKKEEEEAQQQAEEEKKAEALDDHTNVKSTEDASIKYAQGTNVTRTGKDSKGNKVSVVTDVNNVKYGKDMEVNGQLKDATELVAAGEVKNITANGKNYNVLNIDVTKGTGGVADQYKLTLADGTTKTFNQDQISSVKIGNKEYVGCLDTMENIDVQRSGNNTYFYYNTNDLEANLSTNNPTVTAYDANGVAMISTNATSEAGLSMLQQIYDDNKGVQYNARLNTLLGQDWYDKNGHLHDYKTGNLVDNYKNKKLEITDNINSDISSYYSGLKPRNNSDHTDYTATEKYNEFTKNYGENYANKIENSGFSLYDNITTNNSVNTAASYNLNSTYKDRTNCLFA